MTLTCLLIDDEPLARKILKEYIDELPGLKVQHECDNALQAQEYLSRQRVDILYLDINMPRISGIDFIKHVQPLPLVVFTTAYPDFAVEAFELEAFDYLVKPISFKRFIKSFQRITKHLSQDESHLNQDWIKIKEGKRLYKISAEEIFWVQAYGDYVKVFTKEKVYVTKEKLADFLIILPDTFVQIHRSYIINLPYIKYLEGNFAMVEGERIPISNSFKEILMKRL